MTRPLLVVAGLCAAVGALVAAAPLAGLADPTVIDMPRAFAGPSLSHWLGQDQYGRDVLSRLVWGARTSFTVALSSASIAALAGTALGLTAAYYRGLVELVTVRPMDILLCFPPLLLALLVVTLLGPGTDTLVAVLALVFLPNFARVAYGTALSVRERDFVTAMQAIGAGPARIMLRTLLPNIAGPLLVQFSLVIGAAIILEAGLSFLGLGAVPPTASWGLMIGDARATMLQHPLLMIWPCLALSLTILGVNIVCDSLRDRIDPHPTAESLFGRKPAALHGTTASDELLSVDNLSVSIGKTKLVNGVSLTLRSGEVLALVGASGSGKSLTSLAVMGLLANGLDASGSISVAGCEVLSSTERQLRRLRGGAVAMVFQDPASGLNPAQRVGRQIGDAIRAHQRLSAGALRARVLELMEAVEIPDPERRIHAYPHQLSGGMRQRIMIAMAIANRPQLLIADEPTTALDVTVQAQILATLARLKQDTGMGILFVTHSLGVVAEFADRVAVMKGGEIVETGAVREILDAPAHPYTRMLIRNAPENLEPLEKPMRTQAALLAEESHA